MDKTNQKLDSLKKEISSALVKLNISSDQDRLVELKKISEDADFWKDNNYAQDVMRQISKIEQKISPWQNIYNSINELIEMNDLADETMNEEILVQLETIEKDFNLIKDEIKLSGKYDGNDAILSIYAGAGGTDAQDWAQMLLRMYTRWAEKNNYILTLIDQTLGEEAGLKSITLEISGPYAYGKLRSEDGVHRLVRLSPFNSDNLRQTSFAKVEILPKIEQKNDAEIDDKDLRVDVYRSGGHGGQSVNTTDSAVRITHIPTNITVSIQNERSQIQNKELAMTIIRSKLVQLQIEQHKEKINELKGPNKSAEWGNQIRSYVLHPYKQVKDLRSGFETSDPDKVLDGDIEPLIEAFLDHDLK